MSTRESWRRGARGCNHALYVPSEICCRTAHMARAKMSTKRPLRSRDVLSSRACLSSPRTAKRRSDSTARNHNAPRSVILRRRWSRITCKIRAVSDSKRQGLEDYTCRATVDCRCRLPRCRRRTTKAALPRRPTKETVAKSTDRPGLPAYSESPRCNPNRPHSGDATQP